MTFSIELKVRDSECDLQGIVNNSNYLVYLEHARHELLLIKGLDFPQLTAHGIHLVVIRMELNYKQSLKPHDQFTVTAEPVRLSKLKYGFVQKVIREDGKLMLEALVEVAALNEKGRPFAPDFLEPMFAAQ